MSRPLPQPSQSATPTSAGSPHLAKLASLLAGGVNQHLTAATLAPVGLPGQVMFVRDIISADDQVMSSIATASLAPAELCVGTGFSRAKVNRILTRLLLAGQVLATGTTRDRKYSARRSAL